MPTRPKRRSQASSDAEPRQRRVVRDVAGSALATAARRCRGWIAGGNRNGDSAQRGVYPRGQQLVPGVAMDLAPDLAAQLPRRAAAEEHGHDGCLDFGYLLFRENIP